MLNQQFDAGLRAKVRLLHRQGKRLPEIVSELGLSLSTVHRLLRADRRGVRSHLDWQPAPGRLSASEREEIFAGMRANETFAAVARRLSRSVSTVSREVAANGGRKAYRPHRAHRRAFEAAARPKRCVLAERPELATVVSEWLGELWSPQQIAQRLRAEFPHDPMMRVSHETIYLSLFVQGRGGLRRELTRCLRSGRAERKPRADRPKRGTLPDMVSIVQRPPEVADRAVPGHWEGDLIMGKENRSAVGTLVERSTRFVMLLHLEHITAEAVRAAMAAAITRLPAELVRSITWDQGKEMAQHATFTVDTGVQVYFCDPHSPWQRGSNENTNGLRRQYMPKGTDLRQHSEADLDRIAASLNGRPRETLGWMTPSEKLAELLALTG